MSRREEPYGIRVGRPQVARSMIAGEWPRPTQPPLLNVSLPALQESTTVLWTAITQPPRRGKAEHLGRANLRVLALILGAVDRQ